MQASYANPQNLNFAPAQIRVGLHDVGGAQWMKDNALKGVALCHVTVQDQPIALDFTEFERAGIKIILRICYGYADGSGTLPGPAKLAKFEDAVVATLNTAKGVAYVHTGMKSTIEASFLATSRFQPSITASRTTVSGVGFVKTFSWGRLQLTRIMVPTQTMANGG